MLRFLPLITGLLLTITVFGQSFSGIVKDKSTSEPIPYANIFFVELSSGTSTNNDGSFFIEHIPNHKIHVQISFIGYRTIIEEVDFSQINEKEFYLEESHIELEEVVVSVPLDKLQGENTVEVARKKISELKTTAPLTLAEAISAIPGVSQYTTGAGIGKPVIRGLSGNRIVTYAQGTRIENQQWGGEHGLGVGEVGIESVEVIKGPASLLYGSDAIGGVLFFVDERYAQSNSTEGYLESTNSSNTLGSINHFGLKLNKSRFKVNVFGTYASHADYKVPELGRVLNTRFNEKNIKGSLGFNYKKWISNLRYSFLQNDFGIVDEVEYHSSSSRGALLPKQEIGQHNLSFENTIFAGESKLQLVLGYSTNDRKELEEDFDLAALAMKLKTASYNLKWYAPQFNKHISAIFGIQGLHQSNENSGEEILIPDATTDDIGAFGIWNYHTGPLSIQGGIRIDRRTINTEAVERPGNPIANLNAIYNSLNYSLGGVYEISKSTFRLNWSTGFRAPNTSELLSNGIHEGTRRYEIGNAGLKSEKANQIDITYDYQTEHFRFTLNPFYKKIQNYIFLSPEEGSIDDAQIFRYMQSDAELYGGEAGVHYHPHGIHWLHIESNLSTVFAKDHAGQPLPLIPAHRWDMTMKGEFSGKGRIRIRSVFLNNSTNFSQTRISTLETSSPGYVLVNAGFQIEISTKGVPLLITPGINNLLNKKYIPHLSRFKDDGIYNQGVNFVIGLKMGFQNRIVN